MFELLFRYKDSMVLNSICFESKHELYAFVKKENIEVEQIIDKQEIQ